MPLVICVAAMAMLVLAAKVNWPWAFTVNVATWDAEPYEAAVTAVLVMLNVLPVRVKPVPAKYEPAPENCDQVIGVTLIVPPWLDVQTQPVSAKVVPASTNVNALGTSAQVFMSVVRVQPLALAA